MTVGPRIDGALRYIAFMLVCLAFVYGVDQLGLLDEGPWFWAIPVGALLVAFLRDLYLAGDENFIDDEEEDTAC